MSSLADNISIIISVISLAGAGYSFTFTRKTFIFSVCTERAKEVRAVWNGCEKSIGKLPVNEEHLILWSKTISEIVSSIIIIDRLADRYKLLRRFYGLKDFYIIFWQQIPTDLRSAIEGYSENLSDPNNEEQVVFRLHMRTILKTYES